MSKYNNIKEPVKLENIYTSPGEWRWLPKTEVQIVQSMIKIMWLRKTRK